MVLSERTAKHVATELRLVAEDLENGYIHSFYELASELRYIVNKFSGEERT